MKTSASKWLVLTLSMALTACPVASPGSDGGGGGEGGSGGGAATGGGAGGGAGNTGGGTATASDGGVLSPPELTLVAAQVSGRTGRDLRFAVTGKDRDLDVVGLSARLLETDGSPVLGEDLDGDGALDPMVVQLTFDAKRYVGETITASGTARALFDSMPVFAKVAVTLTDEAGLTSAELETNVLPQPIKALGDPCDTTFVMNRCGPSYGCRGSPAICQEGLAPTIARMAFLRASGGPMILLEGVEPEDDLATIHFEFQTTSGAAVEIDSDGNGTPDMASFDFDAFHGAVDGAYFIRLQSGEGLDQQVPVLVAKAIDSAGHASAIKKVAPSTAPVRALGQACDPRGFDVCGPNLGCSPGVVGATNKCAAMATLHTAECTAAPVVTPTANGAVFIGKAEGGSLYDAPSGCSSNDPRGRPESIVTIRLPTRANTLTLTTVRPGTTFDTTLYLLQACPADAANALSCNDDAPGTGASTLELTDIPAGDYQLVIDSFGYAGGTFELFATMN